MSALEVYEAPAPVTLFGTNDPAEVVARATATAQPLAQVIERQNLYVTISGRKHVRVEGWTLLGTMLGVFAVVEWVKPVVDDDGEQKGWAARVQSVTRDGAVVGAAEAFCLRSEANWRTQDEHALASMAQTRATSKALRLPLGFVMALGGYDATPAEEMPAEQPAALAMTDEGGFVGPDGEQYRMEGSGVEALATQAQLRNLHTLVGKLTAKGASRDELRDSILSEFGVASTKDLSKREASEIINRLKAKVAA